MTMDYDARRTDNSVTEAEGVMFAANPVWDRASRRRGLGGRRNARTAEAAPAETVASEPRSFAHDTAPSTLTADGGTDEPGLFAPITRPATRNTRTKASSGAAPAAIAAGAIAVVALGATGWWMTRDASGVPELTPGSTTSEVAVAPIAPAPVTPPATTAPTAPAPAPIAEAPTRMAAASPARAERRAPAVRTRPAAAASAETAATNASATLPSGPQPYTTLNPTVAPTPDNPPPSQAVNPPEPIASTPPIVTDPAPVTTETAPADTTTPPQ